MLPVNGALGVKLTPVAVAPTVPGTAVPPVLSSTPSVVAVLTLICLLNVAVTEVPTAAPADPLAGVTNATVGAV